MNKIDEVLKLKELLDSGLINQSDFDKLKKQVFEEPEKVATELNRIEQSEFNEAIQNNRNIDYDTIKKCQQCSSDNDIQNQNCRICKSDFLNIKTNTVQNKNIVNKSNKSKYYIFGALGVIVLMLGFFFNFFNFSKKIDIDESIISNENNQIIPVIPDELKGKVISSEQIEISWINKTKIDFCESNDYTNWSFVIEREDDKGNIIRRNYCKNETSKYIDKGLNENTIYKYRIYFENDSIKTSKTEITLKTLSLPDTTLICQQTWQTKNLDVTTYNDGTEIYQVTSVDEWENVKFGAWCYYEFNSKNGEIHGKLYNGYALLGIYNEASLEDPTLRKNIAPKGWRIPTYNDYKTLVNCLGGKSVAGGKLKKTGNMNDHMSAQWVISSYHNSIREKPSDYEFNPEYEATNNSLFTAVPCGYGVNSPTNKSYYKNLKFFDKNKRCQLWCVFNETQNEASTLILDNESNYATLLESKIVFPNGEFYSIRCIKE
jgi:hypothetical protein